MGGVIAEVGFELEEFPLEGTIAATERVQCQVEQFVATDATRLAVFLWVDGPDLAGIAEALEADGTIDRATLLTDLGDERLYRMEWTGRIDPLVSVLVEEQGAVLSARGTDNSWCLRLLAPTRDGLSRIYDDWTANDIEVEIHSLYDTDQGPQGRFDLTADQEGTLLTALEHGYYGIPREINMETLADEFDVSHQALSERLRRAHKSLVTHAMTVGEEARTGTRDASNPSKESTTPPRI